MEGIMPRQKTREELLDRIDEFEVENKYSRIRLTQSPTSLKEKRRTTTRGKADASVRLALAEGSTASNRPTAQAKSCRILAWIGWGDG
jgi:hypothetical protein